MARKMKAAIMAFGLIAVIFMMFVSPAGAQSAPNPVASATVVASPQSAGSDSMTVSWVNPAGNNQSSFRIQYSRSSGFTTGTKTVSVAGTATSQVINNIQKGVTYYVRIQAYNANGASAYTDATPFPVATP